jgi:hypothetical protein
MDHPEPRLRHPRDACAHRPRFARTLGREGRGPGYLRDGEAAAPEVHGVGIDLDQVHPFRPALRLVRRVAVALFLMGAGFQGLGDAGP